MQKVPSAMFTLSVQETFGPLYTEGTIAENKKTDNAFY